MSPLSWMVLSVIGPRPTTTVVPSLRVELNASSTTCDVTTPTVTMAWSAPTPLVSSKAFMTASSPVATACVAPNSSALFRLYSIGSTAMMCRAPACFAPCTALMPMPPMPKMTTLSPGRVSAEYTTEPHPVGTPQPTSAAFSSGMSSSIFTTELRDTTARPLKVPSLHIAPRSCWPEWKRNVPSGRQPTSRLAPRSQTFWWPVEHQRHLPQVGRNEQTTWSPTAMSNTPSPTCSMIPAPSWPPTRG